MSREQMIDELIANYMDAIFEGGVERWIEARLREGMPWKCYDDMTDAEIKAEYDLTFETENAA